MGNLIIVFLREYGGASIAPSESSGAKGCLVTFSRITVDPDTGAENTGDSVCESEWQFRYLNVVLFYMLFYYLIKLMLMSTQ